MPEWVTESHLLVHSIKGLQFLQLPPQSRIHVLHQLLPLLAASPLAAAGPSRQHCLQHLLQLLATLHSVLT
jgi:hypothetical protein